MTANSTTASTEWIEQQFNGTINVCEGTKWNMSKPDDKCLNLTIWVNTVTFSEFVDVDKDGKPKGGFSIAILCLVLQELPFKLQPVFKPSVNEGYNEIVKRLHNPCEAVGGDISITANRTEYVDFTIPYMSSEIYMLVPAARKWNQTLLTLVKPFTMRLWLAIISACIFIGVAIGILEYRLQNPHFYNVPFYQKLLMIIWFPVSTIFFHEGVIRNRCSKVVLVIWLTTIFIVMQIFTACLSSWLTVNQLQPKVPKQYHVVGYQSSSFVKDFVNDQVQSLRRVDKGLPLSSLADYKNVLDNGTVDAIFDERPYIDVFIKKYGDNYTKVGPLAAESGLGFAFSRGSPLQREFSKAVVKVTEIATSLQQEARLVLSSPSSTAAATTFSCLSSPSVLHKNTTITNSSTYSRLLSTAHRFRNRPTSYNEHYEDQRKFIPRIISNHIVIFSCKLHPQGVIRYRKCDYRHKAVLKTVWMFSYDASQQDVNSTVKKWCLFRNKFN
ncbi:hypothetical protein L1987_29783 [Smallanthus sonchifolius]|uniref:Uncharacterized protein n=1 Tax=Smallanthus sonchifolius TaxID=185202 RepID=A0ACB9I2I6_9ASTR|nr:hypothetical protein L1987_29783 [Smallanthus sonchifolius]